MISQNVAFNISIPAYSAITARIVGKAVYVESNVLATKRDHFSTSENNEPISEAKGMVSLIERFIKELSQCNGFLCYISRKKSSM